MQKRAGGVRHRKPNAAEGMAAFCPSDVPESPITHSTHVHTHLCARAYVCMCVHTEGWCMCTARPVRNRQRPVQKGVAVCVYGVVVEGAGPNKGNFALTREPLDTIENNRPGTVHRVYSG